MNDDAFLPVALRLDDAEILIVGGGGIAANKTRLVMSRGATIHVIARALGPEMRRWHEEGRFRLAGESVGAALLDALLPRMRAVFAATDDEAVNRLVADRARAHNVLVCAVDDPEPSSFITPAIIDRRPVQIAIMTGGAAPVLARRLRLQIEALLPEGLGRLARFMRGRRPWIRERLPEV
ncbi:precorrin-2 dehydrogenase/sirohydrochlorin ferrochelatase family protein, partial [Acidomonas methanolica]